MHIEVDIKDYLEREKKRRKYLQQNKTGNRILKILIKILHVFQDPPILLAEIFLKFIEIMHIEVSIKNYFKKKKGKIFKSAYDFLPEIATTIKLIIEIVRRV